MSWQAGLLLMFLGLLCIVGIAYAIHDDKTLIKDRELNAHRVTPRFNVGGDAK